VPVFFVLLKERELRRGVLAREKEEKESQLVMGGSR
jgi:hypothetical protein